MTNIIVVFPKIEDAKSIKNVLVRNGFSAMAPVPPEHRQLGWRRIIPMVSSSAAIS